MKTITLSKQQCVEFYVLLNVKPNQIPSFDIAQLEALLELREALKVTGDGFLGKLIELENAQEALMPTKEHKDAEKERIEFLNKHKEELFDFTMEDAHFNVLKSIFDTLGKGVYSIHSWGSIESFVKAHRTLLNVKEATKTIPNEQ